MFRTGCAEILRKAFRSWLAVRLWRLRRRLRQAEIRLGWLGWQCADFGEVAEPHLEKIRKLESQQGELANRGAHLASELAGLTNALTIEKAKSQAVIETMVAELSDLKRRRDQVDGRFEVERTTCARFARAQQELQDERAVSADGEGEGVGRALYIVEGELRDVTARLESHTIESNSGREELVELEKGVRDSEAALRSARRKQARNVRKMMGRIRKDRRHKTTAEKSLRHLEKKKAAPYAAIGIIMADGGVSAANQPETLAEVEAWRDAVEGVRCQIVESRSVSDAVDRAELMRFYFVCGCVLFIAALALVIVWREWAS